MTYEPAKFGSMDKADERRPQVGTLWDSGVTGTRR